MTEQLSTAINAEQANSEPVISEQENASNSIMDDKKLNSALSSYTKRIEKKFESKLAEIETRLNSFSNPKPQVETTNSNTNTIPAYAAEMNLLKQELEVLKQAKEQEVKEKEMQKLENLKLKKIDVLKRELNNQGIKDELTEVALSYLEYNKLVEYDESEKLVFKTDKGYVPINEGLKQFAQSNVGKKLQVQDAPVKQAGKVYASIGKQQSTKQPPTREQQDKAVATILGFRR